MRLDLPPPNWIDRAIGYLDPVRAAKRQRARAFLAMSGAYHAASYARRALSQWVTSSGDADSDILYDLEVLRERSRDLLRNDPLAVGAVNVTVSNAIGTGLKLQSRIDRDVLPISDGQADDWESNTEREFRLWAESPDCDLARGLNFYGHQELGFRSTLENGDVFYAFPRRPRRNQPYDLRLQAIEADRCINQGRKPDTDGLVAGVQKDTDGAPIAYHFLNANPYEPYTAGKREEWSIVSAFGPNTGLRNVLHLFRPLRPGQTRGVPFLSPVIEALKQLGRFTDAELMAAVVSAMFTVFIKSETGDTGFDVSGMGEETGAETTDTDIKLGNGAIVGLPDDTDISIANPQRPNTSFDPFVQAVLRQIGTALEIPFEVLIRHFSSSYSASRAALLEAWRFFKGRRVWMATYFCQPIYEIWLYEAVAKGRVVAPGYFADPMIRKAYSGSIWVGDAPGYIDPQKDVDAAVTRMDNFLSTLDEETALLGGDAEKNLPRIIKERRLLMDAGLWQPGQNKAQPGRPTESGDNSQAGGGADERA